MKCRKLPRLLPIVLALAGIWSLANPAAAYVGPGAAITLVGGLWALLVAVLLAVAGMLVWPLRALLRSRRRGSGAEPAEPTGQDGEAKPEEAQDMGEAPRE